MEREHRSVLTLFAPASFAAGASVRLDEDAAQHARVRRVRAGDVVRLLDGAGSIGTGTIHCRLQNLDFLPTKQATLAGMRIQSRDGNANVRHTAAAVVR